MSKSIYALFLSVFTTGATFAGAQAQPNAKQLKHLHDANYYKAIFASLPKKTAGLNAANKTTATGSRLTTEVAGSYDAANHWLPDSTIYTYTGTHGGDYENQVDFFPLKYSSGIEYSVDATTLAYAPSARYTVTFNTTVDLPAQELDEDWNGAAWENSTKAIYHYNAAGLVDTLTEQYDAGNNNWMNFYRAIITYNAAKSITKEVLQTVNMTTNAFVNMYQSTLTYDANNNLLLSLNQTYNTTTQAWDNTDRTSYRYNSSNLATSQVDQNYTTSWQNSDSVANTFTGNNLTTAVFYSWNASTNTYAPANRSVYNYSSANKLLNATDQTWISGNQYVTADSNYTTYNSFNQRTFFYSTNVPVANGPLQKARYYYTTFNTSGTPAVSGNLSQLKIYPVPAGNAITVSLNLQQPEMIEGAIYDAAGKLVQQWNANAAGAYAKEITLGNIPAGNYWLTIKSQSATATKAFVIAH